jgi:hypothetical protein
MKERITFVHPQGADIDPKLINVKPTELQGPSVKTSREDRLTLSLEEVPARFVSVLQEYQHLSIRWNSPYSYDTIEPFTSRLSPGLHVLHTTASNNVEHSQ